jgi:hypothetical protein
MQANQLFAGATLLLVVFVGFTFFLFHYGHPHRSAFLQYSELGTADLMRLPTRRHVHELVKSTHGNPFVSIMYEHRETGRFRYHTKLLRSRHHLPALSRYAGARACSPRAAWALLTYIPPLLPLCTLLFLGTCSACNRLNDTKVVVTLSGPPGVGKTTLVHLALLYGYEAFDLEDNWSLLSRLRDWTVETVESYQGSFADKELIWKRQFMAPFFETFPNGLTFFNGRPEMCSV